MKLDYAQTLKSIVTGSDDDRIAVLKAIYAQDEQAASPLIDQFYAGVSETTGLVIIQILSDMGGYEAINFFYDVVHHERRYPSWRAAAIHALQRDGHELS